MTKRRKGGEVRYGAVPLPSEAIFLLTPFEVVAEGRVVCALVDVEAKITTRRRRRTKC